MYVCLWWYICHTIFIARYLHCSTLKLDWRAGDPPARTNQGLRYHTVPYSGGQVPVAVHCMVPSKSLLVSGRSPGNPLLPIFEFPLLVIDHSPLARGNLPWMSVPGQKPSQEPLLLACCNCTSHLTPSIHSLFPLPPFSFPTTITISISYNRIVTLTLLLALFSFFSATTTFVSTSYPLPLHVVFP